MPTTPGNPSTSRRCCPCFDDPSVGLAYTNCFIEGHPDELDDYIGDPAPHPLDTFPKFAEACPVPRADRDDEGATPCWPRAATPSGSGARPTTTCTRSSWRAGWRFAYVHKRLARYRWPVAGKSKSADGDARIGDCS